MRGQAHTLEAVAAGLLLLSAIVFAMQVTAVTPLTGSTSSQHIENQQAAVADGLLASELENGTVKPTLLYWNQTGGKFWGAVSRGYETGGPPTVFGSVLNRTFRDRGIAFNVNIYYLRKGMETREQVQLVHIGTPSDHASVARQTVTLYDSDRLLNRSHVPVGTLGNESTYYFAPDAAPKSELYNVLEVEVVVWRM